MSGERDVISRILSGSSIVFLGQILHKGIAFVASIFIARLLGDTGYGLVALVLAFYFIGTNVLSLGLGTGIARNYPQSSHPEERRGILVSSYQLAGGLSITVSILVFLGADLIATAAFREPALGPVLQVIAIAIPLNVISKISQGGIQAIRRADAKVAIQSVINPIVRFACIIGLILAGFEAVGVAGAYTIAAGVTALLAAAVVARNTELLEFDIRAQRRYRSMLSFSVPLMGSTVLLLIMNNVDTVLLGMFSSADVVGQYNVAYTLGQVTLLFYLSLGFMYIPELSELYADGEIERAGTIYRSMTKWIFVLSLPFTLTALLFPEFVITFLYSETYRPATLPFVILIAGFLTHLLVGQNDKTLTAFGNTRAIFVIDTGTLVANVVLNLVLIPRYGAIGAATATAAAYVCRNIGLTVYLYREYGFRPFGSRLFRVTLLVAVIAGLVWSIAPQPSLPLLVAVTSILVLVTGLAYVTFGVEESDVLVAELFEENTGIDLSPLRRLHRYLN